MEKLTVEEFLKSLENNAELYVAHCEECGSDTFHLLIETDGTTAIGVVCTECDKFYPRVEKSPDGPLGHPHPGLF